MACYFMVFCEEILKSQRQGELTTYAQENWDKALRYLGEDPMIMDTLIILANKKWLGFWMTKEFWRYANTLVEEERETDEVMK